MRKTRKTRKPVRRLTEAQLRKIIREEVRSLREGSWVDVLVRHSRGPSFVSQNEYESAMRELSAQLPGDDDDAAPEVFEAVEDLVSAGMDEAEAEEYVYGAMRSW